MFTTTKRVAAGLATLGLAFATIAGTELPAGADSRPSAPLSTVPAGPLSVVPAGGSVALDTPSTTAVALSSVQKAGTKKSRKKSKGAKALAFAKRQLGDRYRYGGTGPNAWDCSGLTRGAWKHAGKRIPRTSQAQARSGKKVSRSHLRKGDLVFFYSGKRHVGIYAGNGKVIHSSRPGKPVSYIKIKYMPYAGARRPA